jgi:hypothetical protein
MRLLSVGCVLAFLFLLVPDVSAQTVSAGVRAGTLGPGAEIATPLTPKLNVRLGAGYLPYSHTEIMSTDDLDVSLTADARVQTASAFLDVYPFGGMFRFSGGLVYNNTSVDMLVLPTDDLQAGNRTFTVEQIGSLSGVLDYKSKIAPFAGFGLGNPVSPGGRVTVMLDAGAMYSGPPQVVMSGTGMIGPSSEQDVMITERLDELRWYPVISLGLAFRF